MRAAVQSVVFALGLLGGFSAIGALVQSNYAEWCVSRPFALGLPLWMIGYCGAFCVPFLLGLVGVKAIGK